VIGHQTVRVDVALRWERVAQLVFGIDLLVKNLNELPIVFTIQEDVLTIDTT
jgi:hypothetical protein